MAESTLEIFANCLRDVGELEQRLKIAMDEKNEVIGDTRNILAYDPQNESCLAARRAVEERLGATEEKLGQIRQQSREQYGAMLKELRRYTVGNLFRLAVDCIKLGPNRYNILIHTPEEGRAEDFLTFLAAHQVLHENQWEEFVDQGKVHSEISNRRESKFRYGSADQRFSFHVSGSDITVCSRSFGGGLFQSAIVTLCYMAEQKIGIERIDFTYLNNS